MISEKPTAEQIREAVANCAPALIDERLSLLGEGWDHWSFRLGEYVLRIPRQDRPKERYGFDLAAEHRLLMALEPVLPARIPIPHAICPDVPNSQLMSIVRFVPGVPLNRFPGRPADGFGASLGRFLNALHSFPVETAGSLGVPLASPRDLKEGIAGVWEDVVERVYPVLDPALQLYIEGRFQAYFGDDENFNFEPRLCHTDLNAPNLLVDRKSGELSGVIDFSPFITDAAGDFAFVLGGGFEHLGIAEQIDDAVREGGIDVERFRHKSEFYAFLNPLHDMRHGLDANDSRLLQTGVEELLRIVESA